MLVVGGGSRSPLWRRIYADVLNLTVIKSNIDQQAAALGAAALAAVGVGLWPDFEIIDRIHHIEDITAPDPTRQCRLRKPAACLCAGCPASGRDWGSDGKKEIGMTHQLAGTGHQLVSLPARIASQAFAMRSKERALMSLSLKPRFNSLRASGLEYCVSRQ